LRTAALLALWALTGAQVVRALGMPTSAQAAGGRASRNTSGAPYICNQFIRWWVPRHMRGSSGV